MIRNTLNTNMLKFVRFVAFKLLDANRRFSFDETETLNLQ